MNHPSFQAMLRYVAESAPGDELLDMDLHIGECEQCREQLVTLLYLKRNFSTVWELLSLEGCVQIQYQIHMAERLLKISRAYPEFNEKLEKLFRDLAEGITMSFKVLIDSFKKLSLISTWPKETTFLLKHDFAGIGSGERGRIEKEFMDGVELLKNGMNEQAVNQLLKIAQRDSELVENCRLNIERDGSVIGCVEANSRGKNILVSYWDFDINHPPELAVLELSGGTGALMVSEFTYDADYQYYFAEFRDVGDGIYGIEIM